MGTYIYRLNKPKKIAGVELGLLKYWDKPSWSVFREDRRLVDERRDTEVGQLYIWADNMKRAHGSGIVRDTKGGWNYWYDTDDRFEDTHQIIVKYGNRWDIIPDNAYISVKVRVKDDFYYMYELYKGNVLCNRTDDWIYYETLQDWTPMNEQERVVLGRYYDILMNADEFKGSHLEKLMLTTGIRFDRVAVTQ